MHLAQRKEKPFANRICFEKLDQLKNLIEAKDQALSAAIKAQVDSGQSDRPNEKVLALVKEGRKAHADFLRELRRIQRQAGISEANIRAVERAREAEFIPTGTEYWYRDVFEARPTEDLDWFAETGLEKLLRIVPPQWLQTEAQKRHRLGGEFLTSPLHLVSGLPLSNAHFSGTTPQRFAQMLLSCRDHLAQADNLDFFAASMFVPEIAVLGNSIEEIRAAGPEAQRKLSSLFEMPDDLVTSTVFELLVGAACVRKGLDIQMLREDRVRKVPDYRFRGFGGVPCVVECKRRLGLTTYEQTEAQVVEGMYPPIRDSLIDAGMHASIELVFTKPITGINVADVVVTIINAIEHDVDKDEPRQTEWGSVAVRNLPYTGTLARTRLYSPDFLQQVFRWTRLESEWDGLLCEVEPPDRIMVNSFRNPICLKWRSVSETAITKKARGIGSLWSDAVKQIPAGEQGFIYIAYPEGSRPEIADARTKHILDTLPASWHRWFVRVPMTVVSRLYPRPIHEGRPDLIESSLPGTAKGQQHWLSRLPQLIFVRQFQSQRAVE